MERALKIIDRLHLVSTVCVFDQAIYSKAYEIKWKEAENFQNCVLMLWIFHLLMMYMEISNKRFSDAEQKDTLIQSSIIAEGSIDSAFCGKCYNRGVRLCKTTYESLLRLVFLDVMTDLSPEIENHLSTLFKSFEESPQETIQSAFDNDALCNVYHNFLDIKIKWEETGSDLQTFWLTFIDMVKLLLSTILSVRSGDWHLFITCAKDIIPYTFAYNNINYARYLTAIFSEMLILEDDFPETYEEFVAANFAVQLSNDGRFSRTEPDKVTEMTLNRDTKTPGGTTGFSTNIGALHRWEINSKYLASLTTIFHQHLD